MHVVLAAATLQNFQLLFHKRMHTQAEVAEIGSLRGLRGFERVWGVKERFIGLEGLRGGAGTAKAVQVGCGDLQELQHGLADIRAHALVLQQLLLQSHRLPQVCV